MQARTRGTKIRIVSVYLHPDNVRDSLQALIKYLRTLDLREWTIRLSLPVTSTGLMSNAVSYGNNC